MRAARVWTISMAVGMTALAAPASGLAADPAVVFVSGLSSQTSFTNADAACEGKEGDTWKWADGPPAALRGAGRQVYTAPAGPGGKAPAPCGTPVPPASMTIDSGGDVDANGRALGQFLEFLKAEYGVEQAQLVAHSDGGIWSRSALTQSKTWDGPQITSLTTLGTPHTGAWSADLAVGTAGLDCKSTACKILRALAVAELGNLGQTAVQELTSTWTGTWNPDQAIGSCAVTTIAGTYLQLPYVDYSHFYLPTDGLVGEASAHAVKSTSIGGLPIPAPVIPNLVNGGNFPVVHSPALTFLGTNATLLTDPVISTEVLDILTGQAAGNCVAADGDGQGDGPDKARVELSRPIELKPGQPRGSIAGDLVLHADDTSISCDGAASLPSGAPSEHLRLTAPGDCAGLQADGPAVISRASGALEATIVRQGRRITLDDVSGAGIQVEQRRGERWVDIELDGKGRGRLKGRLRRLVQLRLKAHDDDGNRRRAQVLLDA